MPETWSLTSPRRPRAYSNYNPRYPRDSSYRDEDVQAQRQAPVVASPPAPPPAPSYFDRQHDAIRTRNGLPSMLPAPSMPMSTTPAPTPVGPATPRAPGMMSGAGTGMPTMPTAPLPATDGKISQQKRYDDGRIEKALRLTHSTAQRDLDAINKLRGTPEGRHLTPEQIKTATDKRDAAMNALQTHLNPPAPANYAPTAPISQSSVPPPPRVPNDPNAVGHQVPLSEQLVREIYRNSGPDAVARYGAPAQDALARMGPTPQTDFPQGGAAAVPTTRTPYSLLGTDHSAPRFGPQQTAPGGYVQNYAPAPMGPQSGYTPLPGDPSAPSPAPQAPIARAPQPQKDAGASRAPTSPQPQVGPVAAMYGGSVGGAPSAPYVSNTSSPYGGVMQAPTSPQAPQAAAATQPAPQPQASIQATHVNRQTGKKIGWNGSAWVEVN
jgi:hypothetical protein